jgi:hypothetical protein
MASGKSKRVSPKQLPSVRELAEIIEKEAKRPLAVGKEGLHFVDFGVVKEWLELLDLSSELFDEGSSWEKVVAEGEKLKDKVVRRTLSKVAGGDKNLLGVLDQVADYLGKEDQPEESDLIFVFGAKSLVRIDKAVGLWKQGLAPVIFISGGSPNYDKREPEALVFKERAMELGVPEEAIVVEPDSISYADNVRRSLNLMDELGIEYGKGIIQVTSWFGQQRAWSHMMKYVSMGTVVYRINAPVVSQGLSLGGWFNSDMGIKLVFNEFVKMRVGVILNTN